MKRKDLIELLEKNGWYLKRNGGNHDIYKWDGSRNDTTPHGNQRELSKSDHQAAGAEISPSPLHLNGGI